MARASGDLNPKAMRWRSLILVLVDSLRPLDRLWSFPRVRRGPGGSNPEPAD